MGSRRLLLKKEDQDLLYVFNWIVEPQQVGRGKPWVFVGEGVLCRRESFFARDCLEEEDEEGERCRNSVARKKPLESDKGPWARERGQRFGTAEEIAFREVCSPVLFLVSFLSVEALSLLYYL